MPVRTPVAESIVATAGFALTQTPPARALANVADVPAHNVVTPVIVAGVAYTVIVVVTNEVK
jgi:hypothetical protein